MKIHPDQRRLGAAVALVSLLLAGCASVFAVTGPKLLSSGANVQVRDFVAEFPEAWDATNEALERLEYAPAESREVDGVRGHIVGESYEVELSRHLQGITRVRVRIGRRQTTANRRMGVSLLQEISKILDTDVQIQEWSEEVEALSEE
jgi:hypothetical protein